jgi:uncharacterized surface protein with fasciclin (FAS1) repeats
MNGSKRTMLGLAAAVVALGLVAAACSDDDSDATAGGEGNGETAAAEPFGAACSDVPATGQGSFEGMMTAPVVQAAAANPLLTSLAMDLELAGLTDTLNSADGVTVFAPSNAAFEAAGEADPDGMAAMMADPSGDFADLLAYHVVEGQLPPEMLAGEHETLQGDTITVDGGGKRFTVNGMAMIVCGNIHTDNATVYVIDEVLHPSSR